MRALALTLAFCSVATATNTTSLPAIVLPGEVCSAAWCTSSGYTGRSLNSCYAGTFTKKCTCSRGEARLTGIRTYRGGDRYYQYLCCEGGAQDSYDGEECGDCCDENPATRLAGAILWCLCCFCCVAGLSSAVFYFMGHGRASAVHPNQHPATVGQSVQPTRHGGLYRGQPMMAGAQPVMATPVHSAGGGAQPVMAAMAPPVWASPTGPLGDKGEWATAVDPSTGNTYYYHKITGETMWNSPYAPHPPPHPPPPAHGSVS